VQPCVLIATDERLGVGVDRSFVALGAELAADRIGLSVCVVLAAVDAIEAAGQRAHRFLNSAVIWIDHIRIAVERSMLASAITIANITRKNAICLAAPLAAQLRKGEAVHC
jgi:hypothetical protein